MASRSAAVAVRLAAFSPGYVVPTIAAGRRLASQKKRSRRDSPEFSNMP